MTAIIAALVDAWTELRIHRARVLLSLFGVAVAIAALTASVALGSVLRNVNQVSMETWGGRAATVSFQVSGESLDAQEADAAFREIADRYSVSYSTANVQGTLRVQTSMGAVDTNVLAVDPDFQLMHRTTVSEGRWLADEDNQRLAPAVLANSDLLSMIGISSLASHPTFELPDGRTAVIVGELAGIQYSGMPTIVMTPSAYFASIPAAERASLWLNYEVWVGEADAETAQQLIVRDLRGALPGAQVDGFRTDYAASQDVDPTAVLQAILVAISSLILLLGALSLVNIAIVTVRQRVREIGIRRAFGAGRARIFFSVMLESVVATLVAGVVGVMVTVFVYRTPMTEGWLSSIGIAGEMPPFPFDAALTGIIVATVVGAIAGVIPATVAVRAKVIDAIRF